MDNIEKVRRKIKELQDEFISIQPKDCSLKLIKSYAGYVYLDKVLSFLDTLESENPLQEGLEEEIERYLPKIPENPYNEELRVFARHFAEWGAEHAKR